MPLAIFVRDLRDPDGTPVFASSDPVILRALAGAISQRLGAATPPALREVKRKDRLGTRRFGRLNRASLETAQPVKRTLHARGSQ